MSGHSKGGSSPERGCVPAPAANDPSPCLGGVGDIYDAMGDRLPARPCVPGEQQTGDRSGPVGRGTVRGPGTVTGVCGT